MVDIQSAVAEIRRGKKDRKIENHRAKMQCPHLLRRAAITTDEKPKVNQMRTTITN